ncbi:MAG: L-rhamnose isomerase [Actinobacteria bacterium]|nr:L-rhamnose isomerase [Actinomycetota bacterium]
MSGNSYEIARDKYATIGIDTDEAINKLKDIPVSIHSWQLDDVMGFEVENASLPSGGVISIGNYPGRSRNIEEYRSDLEKVLSLVPGLHKKISLQANEGDYKGRLADRNDISKNHFDSWIDWARENKAGLDVSPVFYSHKYVKDGYTLASKEKFIREYWIEYGKKNREIANYIGKKIQIPCISNLWVPDGSKDITPSRNEHRQILKQSLDEIYEAKYPRENLIDTVESKLFGIGFEFYNVGSLEFYLAYAMSKRIGLTFDTGHLHPTEMVSDKISSVLPFLENVVLHLSRGIRWDSDHITVLTDELTAIMQEINRADAFNKVHIGTDFFDASINRIGALSLGVRAVCKALLLSLLEPVKMIKDAENSGDNFSRLALMEDLKSMPYGSVWSYYCETSSIPNDFEWIKEVLDYEKKVLANRK